MAMMTGSGRLFLVGGTRPLVKVDYCLVGAKCSRTVDVGGWVQVSRRSLGALDGLDALELELPDRRRLNITLLRRRADLTTYDFTGVWEEMAVTA